MKQPLGLGLISVHFYSYTQCTQESLHGLFHTGAICRNRGVSSDPQSCFWSRWMNLGTGDEEGRASPHCSRKGCSGNCTPLSGDLYMEFGGRMRFPSSSGKSMSAHGENCLDQQGGKKNSQNSLWWPDFSCPVQKLG